MLGYDAATKLILIQAELDGYYEGAEPVVNTTEITNLQDLVGRFGNEIANDFRAMEALLKNEAFVKALDQRGFRNIEKITDVEAKAKAGKRFFIHDGTLMSMREMDLTALKDYDIDRLADDKSVLLQTIEKSSLRKISPSAYKRLCKARKRLEDAEAAKQARAEQRAAKKKEKQLEAARKLLEANTTRS